MSVNSVDSKTYDTLVSDLDRLCREIIAKKRPVYTQGFDTAKQENVIRNFEQVAEMTGMTPGQVLAVYLAKQVLSVMVLLTNPNINDEERDTRFADARNYTDIAYVMYKTGKTQHG